MRITVVGCSGSYPGPDSPASSYLIEADQPGGADDGGTRTWRILVDIGNGALGQLHHYVDPLRVDAVLISHHHPDHYGDICGYYVLRKYHPAGAQPQIPVWGPTGTADRFAGSYGLPLDPGMHGEFDFREYDGTFDFGPFEVQAIRVDHPVEAYGLRITAHGSTVGYSGDTAPCDGLDVVAAGVQLLLAEASFRETDDNPPHVHLTGRDAGSAATRASAERLVLTHIPPWFDPEVMLAEARTEYAGPIHLAAPGAVYEV